MVQYGTGVAQPLSAQDREIAEALGPVAEIVGGGTMLSDPPVSDFAIEVATEDPPSEIATSVWRVLAGIEFTQPTTLTVEVDGQAFPRP